MAAIVEESKAEGGGSRMNRTASYAGIVSKQVDTSKDPKDPRDQLEMVSLFPVFVFCFCHFVVRVRPRHLSPRTSPSLTPLPSS